MAEDEQFPWHIGVYDAHCHPTTTASSLDSIPQMKTQALTIMGTRAEDQELVARFAEKFAFDEASFGKSDSRGRVVPAFGRHPWFSHQIIDDTSIGRGTDSLLPSKDEHYRAVISPSPDDEIFLNSLSPPLPLSALVDQMRTNLQRFPLSLVGEIGLDSAFRIPGTEFLHEDFEPDPSLTPGVRGGRRLSRYRVSMGHQRKLLTVQLNLAGQLQRAVSVHGVAAHGVLFETLRDTWRGHEVLSKREKRRQASVRVKDDEGASAAENGADEPHDAVPLPYPPRICLHSFSGTVETVKLYLHPSIPAAIFFSFSHLVNFSNPSDKAIDVIKSVPDDRILAESDLHAAGDQMDELMEQIVRKICEIKGWSLMGGVTQLAANWQHYITGEA